MWLAWITGSCQSKSETIGCLHIALLNKRSFYFRSIYLMVSNNAIRNCEYNYGNTVEIHQYWMSPEGYVPGNGPNFFKIGSFMNKHPWWALRSLYWHITSITGRRANGYYDSNAGCTSTALDWQWQWQWQWILFPNLATYKDNLYDCNTMIK